MQELLFSKYFMHGDFWGTYAVHDVNLLQCESSTAGSVSTAQNLKRPSHIDPFNYSALVKSKYITRFLLQYMARVFFVDSVASTG